MTNDQAVARQAAHESLRAELLRELEAAHLIIRNALNIMTVSQKLVWAQRNAHHNVDGEGTTRANEREAVINRARGEQS